MIAAQKYNQKVRAKMKRLASDDVEKRRDTIKEAWDYLGKQFGSKKAVLVELDCSSEAVRKYIIEGDMPGTRAKQWERLSRGAYKREQLSSIFAP